MTRFSLRSFRHNVPLTAIASLLLLALLAVTAVTPLRAALGRAVAGRPLAAALQLRAASGYLPGGPGTPGLYALARAADEQANPARRLEIERSLEQSLAALNGVAGAHTLRGVALGTLGRYPEAQAELRAAPANDLFAQLALGNVLDAQGDAAGALAAWQRVNAERALSLQLSRAGAALANQGQRTQGEALLRKAIAIDPNNGGAYQALGGFYWSNNRAEALAMYRRALEDATLEPFFRQMALGRIALEENRLEDAAAALQAAIALQPENGDAVALLGSTLGRLGRLSEAITLLQNASQQTPNAFWPLVELGQIYVDLGEYDQAIATLTTAAGRRTDVARPFELLATAYEGQDQLEQAARAWQQAITVAPGNASYQARLGAVLAAAGEREQAAAAYRRALEINPQLEMARRGLQALGMEP
ncbi:MAG: tetratricopeptide repeat protein [Caldilineales bacterium]